MGQSFVRSTVLSVVRTFVRSVFVPPFPRSVVRTFCCSVDLTVIRYDGQSVIPSVGQSVIQSCGQSVRLSGGQSFGHTSVSRTVSRSVRISFGRLFIHSVSRSPIRLVFRPNDQKSVRKSFGVGR